jgi:hypothetical protein
MPNGKICYLEMPAADAEVSAGFYEKVFGWRIRGRGEGSLSFDDTTGGVSGSWVVGRKPSPQPGIIISVMVDDIDATLEGVVAAGGKVASAKTALSPGEAYATFLDPAGNLLALYQEAR